MNRRRVRYRPKRAVVQPKVDDDKIYPYVWILTRFSAFLIISGGWLCLYIGYTNWKCRAQFEIMEGVKLLERKEQERTIAEDAMMCMKECSRREGCVSGSFDDTAGSNCFFSTSTPFEMDMEPLTSPTGLIFVKKSAIDPGRKYIRYGNIMYHLSKNPMFYKNILGYCTESSKIYYPAVLHSPHHIKEMLSNYEKEFGLDHRSAAGPAIMAMQEILDAEQYKAVLKQIVSDGLGAVALDKEGKLHLSRFTYSDHGKLGHITENSHQSFYALCQSDIFNSQRISVLVKRLFKMASNEQQ